ncbi:MAG: energy-coupling factor ABC transporter permease [Rhodospirillales bacterium]|nr:energy-coupling factor ABC transporter permease [Rhodospirillales bacterium]
MHIEPGFVQPAKVIMANAGALTIAVWAAKEQLKDWARASWSIVKTLCAASFFSLFMESFAMPVGPSELHFVGAMAIYLTLGFLPTLMGFAIGLLFQGLMFSPWDLPHLGVNSLSLILPLVAMHYVAGRKLFDGNIKKRLDWTGILKLDAMYYSGVTGMVGFWLWFGGAETAFSSWLTFAASYLVVVAVEPLITWTVVKGLKKAGSSYLVRKLFVVGKLQLA